MGLLAILVNILIVLLIAGIFFAIVQAVFAYLPIPAPLKNIVLLILGLLIAIWLLGLLIGFAPPLYAGHTAYVR